MPLRYVIRLMSHIEHDGYEPAKPEAIARDMRIPEEDRQAFDEAVRQLIEENFVERGDDGRLRLPHYAEEITGRLKVNPRGFGFVIPDQPFRDGDLFIPPGSLRDAVSGDTVRAKVYRSGKRGARPGRRFNGRVIEVVKRGRAHFVGVLVKQDDQWYVHPDGNMLHDPVVIRDPHAKNATAGDKVVIELLHYPEEHYLAEGVIVEVLGEAGKPDVETQAVIAAHGLRTGFSDEAVDEARGASRRFDEETEGDTWPNREDLTDTFTITIDPPDAKDFDDAITIEYDEQKREWTLGVHIADVAHFVRHEGPLDQEAQARANSVYLPRYTIPMLPEVLSNGVCSLQEGVPRFAKSMFITLDEKGDVRRQRASATVIRSNKRLTYLEAQSLIDGDPEEAARHARTGTDYSDELITRLKGCDRLARILEQRRHRHGMIVLNLPEVELVFDDHGRVIDAQPEDDAYTHKVIEMFMVEANEAVARLFDSLGIAVLRRIHPDPVSHDLDELQMYARAVKYRLPEEPTRDDLQRFLEATRETPAARAVHLAVLKTLTKASYSPALIGHFALGSEHYAHFTSPIRRYPDLTVHRALTVYLELTDNGTKKPKNREGQKKLAKRIVQDQRVLDETQLITLGRHCSEMEVAAADAERELRDFLVMQFLKENHLGDSFEGVVTGVTSNGAFISIDKFLVEGMARLEDFGPLNPEKRLGWRISEQTGRLHSKSAGTSIGVGDVVTVQITDVDLAARHLDMLITALPQPATLTDGELAETGGTDLEETRQHSRIRGRGRKSKEKSKGGGQRKGKGKSRGKPSKRR